MKIYNRLSLATLSCLFAVQFTHSAYASPWPTATPDSVTVGSNQRVNLPVLSNDIGTDLSLIEVNTVTVALGSVEMSEDKQTLYYTSAGDYSGEDAFWYAFTDDEGRTNSTKVTLDVRAAAVVEPEPTDPVDPEPVDPEPVDPAPVDPVDPEPVDPTPTDPVDPEPVDPIPTDPVDSEPVDPEPTDPVAPTPEEPADPSYVGWPTATTDIAETLINQPITIDVLSNDIGQSLEIIAVDAGTVSGGAAAIDNGKVTYTPKAGYTGADSFWYAFTDAQGRTNSTAVNITVNLQAEPVPPIDVPPVNLNFTHVRMHYDLLDARSFIYGENGGVTEMVLSEYADAGDDTLRVTSAPALKDGQLITYRANDNDYYTIPVSHVQGRTIHLESSLPASVSSGMNVWNFYDNGSHPNWFGYTSIADFALRNLDAASINTGKHVMLGDSWFQSAGIEQRLASKLSNATVVNRGIGGNTSADMLARFDADIASRNPDFVWLIAGTNDYYLNVSLEDYTANMQAIIEKINALGAQAIVIDSSVAPLMLGSEALTDLSHDYSVAIEELSGEAE